MKQTVQVREQVKVFLEQLAPEPRRRIKSALKALAKEQGDRLALRENLAGYHRLRVGGYRVIFRYLRGGLIECVYAEERSLVYKLFEREMLERLRHETGARRGEREPFVEEPSGNYSAARRKKPRAKKTASIGAGGV